MKRSAIAIVGLACRFPGAETPDRYWQNLVDGVESLTWFSDEELLAAGVAPEMLADESYVKASPTLRDHDCFDGSYFGYSPMEAATMDPQQRLFLEVVHAAFEDAGHHPGSHPGPVGVFGGAGGSVTSYLVQNPAVGGETGSIGHLGNDKDFLTTRVSFKLDLRGPSVDVQTACSTSLVAVHLACQSLKSGESDMVVAGASTVRVPQVTGYRAEQGNILSPDGHCRPFDADALGTIFGSGVGAVVLRRLDDALADGDHVYALILGSAVNNDGARKMSYTSSSVSGQALAMVEALVAAEVDPESLGYVECHGTGTAVGDPLEVQALTQAFRTTTRRQGFCAIGSVKGNIGHLEQAAGMASLIKTALALDRGQLPPSLNFQRPNRKIDFAKSPFFVNAELQPWPRGDEPRRAAVNALGLGGTNAFVVLEEAPQEPASERAAVGSAELLNTQTLCLSARSEVGLSRLIGSFREYLAGEPEPLEDVCFTANASRSQEPVRAAFVADSLDELRSHLEGDAVGREGSGGVRGTAGRPTLAFLFTGQGSQYTGMARELDLAEPVFRASLDRCDEVLEPLLGHSLRSLMHDPELAEELASTRFTQPVLVALEGSLAELWKSWGIEPAAVIGHSVGEFAAAVVSGVLSLEDGLRLAAERGRLMQEISPSGSMMAVFAGETAVREVLEAELLELAVAAVNGPANTVVSGDEAILGHLAEALTEAGLAFRPLKVSHAFHSSLMKPILGQLEAIAGEIEHRAPKLPWISNLTGEMQTTTPTAEYWRRHAREPVRFADGMAALADLGIDHFLEVGPGTTLLAMGRQCLTDSTSSWASTLHKDRGDRRVMLEAAAQLYVAGAPVNWSAIGEGRLRRRVSLPTYPFERRRHWVAGEAAQNSGPGEASWTSAVEVGHPLVGRRLQSPIPQICFDSRYDLVDLPWLDDHRIFGDAVLPTTAGLEALERAGREALGMPRVAVEEVVYQEALTLPERGRRAVQLIVTPEEGGASFELASSRPGDDAWRVHMMGKLRPQDEATGGGEPFPLEEVRSRLAESLEVDRYYDTIRAVGFQYGPAFRRIQELYRGDGEALVRVEMKADVSSADFALHPALLDACLHVYPALVEEYGDFRSPIDDSDGVYLPTRLEAYRVLSSGARTVWAHAVRRRQAEGMVVDLRLQDEAGRPVAEMQGLHLRKLRPDALRAEDGVERWLYRTRWELEEGASLAVGSLEDDPPAPGEQPESWWVLPDHGGAAEELARGLRAQGTRCKLLEIPADGELQAEELEQHLRRWLEADGASGVAGLVFPAGLDAGPFGELTYGALQDGVRRTVGSVLQLVRALENLRAESVPVPRLWLVTRSAQNATGNDAVSRPQLAPLWGLGRVVAEEAPHVWGGLVDLGEDEDGTHLALALDPQPGSHREVAVRGEKLYVPRLERLETPEEASGGDVAETRLLAEASYLITGGLGALGLRVADWLRQRGARHLVLTGRSGARGAAAEAVERLRAAGVRVLVVPADVAVEEDVKRLLEEISAAGLPPLRGLWHCAGSLDDGILTQMSWEQFTGVTAPKIEGGFLLHSLLDGPAEAVELDHFVVFSSILSVTGSAGQANYCAGNAFLDALVQHRRSRGLPAQGINWGPWAEAGLATVSGETGEAIWKRRGTRYIPPTGGMEALARIIDQDVDHAVVTLTDWSVFLDQYPEDPPLYRTLRAEVGASRRRTGVRRPVDLLDELAEAERYPVIAEFLRTEIAAVLGLEEAVPLEQPIRELGLDSLMAVNLANRLAPGLGKDVPAVVVIPGPSVAELIAELYPGLEARVQNDEAARQAEDSPAPEERAERPAGDPAVAHSSAGHSSASQSSAGQSSAGQSSAAQSSAAKSSAGSTATLGASGDDNGWLVPLSRSANARSRLFCFPFAGGGSAVYRPWVGHLDSSIELFAVEPPGRLARIHEAPVESMQEFVNCVIEAMTPYLDKPFAFFGHCLGGLTAFETAKALRRRAGVEPGCLFVSGARSPDRMQQSGPFEELLSRTLVNNQEYDLFLPAHQQPDTVFAEIIRHFQIADTERLLADDDLRELVLPVVRAEFQMSSSWRYTRAQPFAAPIVCFAGSEDVYVTRQDAAGWCSFTDQGFELQLRPGGHFLLVDDREFILQSIAGKLARI